MHDNESRRLGWVIHFLESRFFDIVVDGIFGALAGWFTYWVLSELTPTIIVAVVFFLLCIAYQTGLEGVASWIFIGWCGGLISAREIDDWSVGIGVVVAIWLTLFIMDHWPARRGKQSTGSHT